MQSDLESIVNQQHICKSCNNTFIGLYCNQCGEKVLEPKDRKFSNFLGKVVIATSIVDNKFVRTLWLILSNPGFLSTEYAVGRRVNYMRPLQLFFILNLIYFLFPVLQLFNSSFYTHVRVLPHRSVAMLLASERMEAKGWTIQGLELLFNDKTGSLAKLLMVVFVLLATLPLSLIFRSKNKYLTDHAALAVELASFNLAVNAIGLSIVLWFVNFMLHWILPGQLGILNDTALTIFFVATNLYFLIRCGRTFYNQPIRYRFIKAILGIGGLFLALEIYRFLVFLATLYTI